MHSAARRREALALVDEGRTVSAAARAAGLPVSTVRDWARQRDRPQQLECPRCTDGPLDEAAYSAVLGFYLGDGCISQAARYQALRITCDATWPGIVDDVTHTISLLRPSRRVFHVRGPGTIVVQAHWQHWTCLFPQHGPGRKHLRPIVLQPWQVEVVERHPGPFLRGLFHSDGCRVANWTTRRVRDEVRRYNYARWQFSNRSEDILGLCGGALDLVDVAWRRSAEWTISVSRREAVARLDELVGLKT